MITSRKDLEFYIQNDCKSCTGRHKINIFLLYLHCYYGNDLYRVYRYLRSLRKYEYALNCYRGPLGRILQLKAKVCWHRLGAKYNININPNTVGYGLRCPHLVGGVIINAAQVGNFCTINSGVIVGKKGCDEFAVIGNNVELCVGCKVIGGVVIGDNVIVAPNSVVVNDVPANAIVSGIPAKIIKYRETSNITTIND